MLPSLPPQQGSAMLVCQVIASPSAEIKSPLSTNLSVVIKNKSESIAMKPGLFKQAK